MFVRYFYLLNASTTYKILLQRNYMLQILRKKTFQRNTNIKTLFIIAFYEINNMLNDKTKYHS